MGTKFLFIQKPSSRDIEANQAFADQHWGEHFHKDDENLDFFAKPDYLAQLFIDGDLTSSLVIFMRELTFQEIKYSFAGIGGVVTHAKLRRRGYATRLLQESMLRLLPLCDFALLCTDIEKLSPLYSRVGFVPLGRPYFFLDKNGLKKPEIGSMIAPLSSASAVDLILHRQDEIFVGISNF